jgi:hypothetical protein
MKALLLAVAIVTAAGQGGSVEIIATENMSNVDEPKQAVARTAAEWEALWRSHASDRPLPAVDLGKRTVVAVFLGSRPTAGYQVEIVGARQEGKGVIVEWAEVRPKPGMMLAQVLTSPAIIASIPKADGDIGFRKVTK